MSYKLLPDGNHQWTFRLGGRGTAQKQVTSSDFKAGEKEVRRLKYEFENGINVGDTKQGVTFFDICAGYLADQTEAPTTTKQKRKTLGSHIECFKRQIPNYRLGHFNNKEHEAYNAVDRWMKTYRNSVNRLGKGRTISPASVRRKFNTLRAIFNWAVNKGFLRDNPAKRVKKPKVDDTLPRFLDQKEIKALFETARRPQFVNYCTLILNTGMRPGEALGLEIEHIDPGNRVIAGFRQKNGKLAVVKIKDSLVGPLTKMIGNRTSGSLLNYSAGQLREDAEYGIKTAKINRIIKPGTSPFTIYGLRHTFASHLLMAGEPMSAVAAWLRNSSAICDKHYKHLTEKFMVDSGNKIDLVPKMELKVIGEK